MKLKEARTAAFAVVALAVTLAAVVGCAEPAEKTVYQIYVVDPPFNSERVRTEAEYQMLERAQQPWRIGVVIPHLKDDYWTGVVYGLTDTARELGINLEIYEAGGYEYLDVQRAQIRELLDEYRPDGLIISAISQYDLADLVEEAHDAGIPVLDLINGMESPYITARVASSFVDHGEIVAERILSDHQGSETTEVAWFPGPDGAGWVAAANKGFMETLEGTAVVVDGPYFGDTGSATQERLIRQALADHPDITHIAGTAVTAEVAVSVLKSHGLSNRVSVLAFYYSAGVHRGIVSGEIDAAPTDLQAVQARIAVDTVVRVIEGKPFYTHTGPQVVLVDGEGVGRFDSTTSLAPVGFRTIMTMEAP